MNLTKAITALFSGGALGTPSSGTLTSCTGLPIGGITMNTARLLGRTTASAGAAEEITVGSGLSLSAGSLTATGSSALTYLSTVTANNSATVDVETTFDATYDAYMLVISGVVPQTSEQALTCLMKLGGSYANSAYAYHVHLHGSDAATYSASVSTSAASIEIANSIGNASGYNGNVTMFITHPSSTSLRKYIHWQGAIEDVNRNKGVLGYGMNTATTALTGLRFAMASGNITSGTFRLYGIVNS